MLKTRTSIASESRMLDICSVYALIHITLLITTTIHVQDFEDCVGDARISRQTLIILYPGLARFSVLPITLFWSCYLAQFWEVGILISISYIGLSIVVGIRYQMRRSLQDDRYSYVLYNVCWILTANLMLSQKLNLF